ncbi:MAG: hypothetical protein U0R44_06315 [Candidatus Micrarchaeia archaeon]
MAGAAERISASSITATSSRPAHNPVRNYRPSFESIILSPSGGSAAVPEKLAGALEHLNSSAKEKGVEREVNHVLRVYARDVKNDIVLLTIKRLADLVDDLPSDRLRTRLSEIPQLMRQFPELADTVPELVHKTEMVLGGKGITVDAMRKMIGRVATKSNSFCPVELFTTMKMDYESGSFDNIEGIAEARGAAPQTATLPQPVAASEFGQAALQPVNESPQPYMPPAQIWTDDMKRKVDEIVSAPDPEIVRSITGQTADERPKDRAENPLLTKAAAIPPERRIPPQHLKTPQANAPAEKPDKADDPRPPKTADGLARKAGKQMREKQEGRHSIASDRIPEKAPEAKRLTAPEPAAKKAEPQSRSGSLRPIKNKRVGSQPIIAIPQRKTRLKEDGPARKPMAARGPALFAALKRIKLPAGKASPKKDARKPAPKKFRADVPKRKEGKKKARETEKRKRVPAETPERKSPKARKRNRKDHAPATIFAPKRPIGRISCFPRIMEPERIKNVNTGARRAQQRKAPAWKKAFPVWRNAF